MSEERCIACDNEFDTARSRRICCNGIDCGCQGATIPDEFCSLACYENYDPTPWCAGCGAMKQKDCHCGPIAEND
jgi:hypothetical protein